MTSVLFKAVPNRLVVQLLYFVFIYKGSTATTTAGVPNLRSSARRTFFHFAPGRQDLDKKKIGDCRVVGSDVIGSGQSRCCCLLLWAWFGVVDEPVG